MARKVFIIFLAAVSLFNTALLYSAEPLDLGGLIKEAKENNPEILAAKSRYIAAKARIPQAKSLENPSIGFTSEKIPRGTLKLNKTMAEDRMLSINQAIPWFGKLSLKGKIALVESQMFAAEYKQKELVVINAVKNAYYDLFMNNKEIELNEQSLTLLKSITKAAEVKYAVGEMTQEELFKLNLEIARLSNVIINLREERKVKETRLNTLLNRGPEATLGMPDLAEEAYFHQEIKSLYQATLLNQPELIIFSYAIEKNRYAKSLAKRSFFPDMMTGIVQRGITAGTIGPWDLMLSFTVPLWFWTKQRYEVKEAIANLEEAEAAYKAMQNKAFSETKDLATRIEIAKNRINLSKTNLIPILESSIASSLAAFSSGKGDFMLLLDNQRSLIETKMEYYKALVEYNMNLADLERTVGIDLREVKK
ncbi:MAG: TolC family protein [Candidatus Omnitrophota bacterium]|nr:TolC family protein [Candidatus Omnitrophota bacterium]